MTAYEITASNGDEAEAGTFAGAKLAARTLVDDGADRADVHEGCDLVGHAARDPRTGAVAWYGSTLDRSRR